MYIIKDLEEFSSKQNGKCLSKEYIKNDSIYEWECENGHIFTKTWTTLLRKNSIFCKECLKTKDNINNITHLQEYAKKNNGKCLSTTYKKSITKYKFICENEHEFEKTWVDCNRSKWFCIKCNQDNEINIEKLKQFAFNKGGKCLSEKYINSYTNYEWQCENNHNWLATWINVGYKNSTWCPECKLITPEKIKEFIENKNGKIIKYIEGDGSRSRYIIECDNKHQWEVMFSNLFYNNTWCLECLKLNLEDCIFESEKRNGKCLDNIYINCYTKMKWKCEKEHIFECPFGPIKYYNRWCRQCVINNMKHDISLAYELALKNEGECLSTEYINLETHMKWKCKEGHIWETALQCIKNGKWCLKCKMRKRRDKALERLELYCNKLGGKILTKKEDIPYDIDSKLINIKAQCSKGHIWNRTLQIFLLGTWCPSCRFKSESKCREILEDLFNVPFIKKRLECMERLELDGYNEKYNLAFEYNGLQHEKFIDFFHRNGIEDFLKQQERDERKLELCEKNNIDLIIIPSCYDYTKPKKLKEFIIKELEKFYYYVI